METENLFGNDHPEFISDNENEEVNPEEEAIEVPANASKPVQPKKVIKNPRIKLDTSRLLGPRGIGILETVFKNTELNGQNCEEELASTLKTLEHWAHRLFPKATFDDTLKQIEKLGTKKPVQNQMKRLRLDLFQSDEFTDDPDVRDANGTEVDIFDELLGKQQSDKENNSSGSDNPIVENAPIILKKLLTAEQIEKMEKNKKIAEEIRKLRFLDKLEKERQEILQNRKKNEACKEISSEIVDSNNSTPIDKNLNSVTSGKQDADICTEDDVLEMMDGDF